MQPKYCFKCGKPLIEGDNFCRKCGSPILKDRIAEPGVGKAGDRSVKKADIVLSLEELLRGCTKVVDFGTGKRFEIKIPAGLSPGDTLVITDTGITDAETGNACDIELNVIIGQTR